jgi:hypothetical protein
MCLFSFVSAGFWFCDEPAFVPSSALQSFLGLGSSGKEAKRDPVVYVGFGSMGAAGLVPHVERFVSALLAALRACRLRAVVSVQTLRCFEADDADADSEFSAETESAGSASADSRKRKRSENDDSGRTAKRQRIESKTADVGTERERVAALWSGSARDGLVYLAEEDIPHSWLFPRCVAAVHHGYVAVAMCSHSRVDQLACRIAAAAAPPQHAFARVFLRSARSACLVSPL